MKSVTGDLALWPAELLAPNALLVAAKLVSGTPVVVESWRRARVRDGDSITLVSSKLLYPCFDEVTVTSRFPEGHDPDEDLPGLDEAAERVAARVVPGPVAPGVA